MFRMGLSFNKIKCIEKTEFEFKYDMDEDDYNYDCVLQDICHVFYETEGIVFCMSGFGDDNWGVDCRADLPCVLEQMDVILYGIEKKQEFEIDFYEQGMERTLKFSFHESKVIIKCDSRNNWIPKSPVEYMGYDEVKIMFWRIYCDFVECVKKLLPKVVENSLFVEWVGICSDMKNYAI